MCIRDSADLALDLEVGAAAVRRGPGDADLGEDLAVHEAGLEQRDEQVVDRHGARALGAADDDLGVVGEHGRRVVVGGSACARLPPTVALLRTSGSAMTLAVSRSSG